MSLRLDRATQVQAHNVTVRAIDYRRHPALEVRRKVSGAAPDSDTFAFVPGLDFHDGTIELEVAGNLLPDAPPGARGFVGAVFRVQVADGSFACEGLYVRPTNGRAEDQCAATIPPSTLLIPDTILPGCAGKHPRNMNR